MMINKFIKYTSILVLGIWMTAYPGVSSAENKKVEDDVHKTIETLMQKDKNGSVATKLNNEEIRSIREKKKTKIQDLTRNYEATYKNIQGLMDKLKSVNDQINDNKDWVDKSLWEKYWTIRDPFGLERGAWKSFASGVEKFFKWAFGADNDSVIRTILDGSFEWSLRNLIRDAQTIDISGLHLEQKDKAKANKLQSLVTEFNNLTQQIVDAASEGITNAYALDQLTEEYDALPRTLGSEQTLYKYTQNLGIDKDGNPIIAEYYFIMDADGTLKSITGVTRGCVPLPAKLAESRSCIFCPLFKTIFNAAQSMSTKAYSKLADPLANVMLIGFALVVAFMVLKNVSSFTKQDAPKFITELLVNMFKVLLAYYMLKNANIVYGYIIGPVLKAGFEFGSSLLFAKKDNYLSSCNTAETLKYVSNGVMPAYLYTNLDCFIKAVQAEVAVPQSIGSSLMCVARNAGKENVGPVRNVLWDFGMMFQGLAIWVMGWIIALAFAFYLIDATIQLGIIGALMPFLIACWPFKVTRKYTNTGWGMFMNTFFVYVFMGLVVSVNVELLGQGLTGSKGGFDAIEAALNGNDVQQLKALLDIGFSGFLVLVACCLFAFKLTGQASSLAGTMAGGGGPSIGAGIGGLAYGAATKAVQGTTKKGLGAAKFVSDRTGLTGVVNRGKDAVINGALGMVGLGRRSGAAGNRSARANQKQASQNSLTPPNANPAVTDPNVLPGGNPTTENQVKKMADAGPRQQQPVVPEPQVPNPTQQGSAAGQETTQTQSQQTQTPEQLKQQLEKDYNNTANGKAGQQMIQVQAAEVARNQKTENDAKGKMNYHNRRADDYLNKAAKTSDPAQKKNFENLANAQFAEAVKAEAAYNKAKADTQKSQAELNSIKQENDRYKNQYVQDEMKKRNPAK